jgi:penicillin-binding protein 1B
MENRPTPDELEPGNQEQRTQPELVPTRRPVKIAITFFSACLAVLASASLIYYVRLGRVIDQRLSRGPFADTVNVFSTPRRVAVGDAFTRGQLTALLQRRGYMSGGNSAGRFEIERNAVAIIPGPHDSGAQPYLVEFGAGKITRISSLQTHTAFNALELEPELIGNLSTNRENRHIVRFADIPPRMVQAVISAEDKRFFDHPGVDFPRLIKAAYVDVKSGRKEEGASTISMQLVRSLWLEPDKSWRRKLQELLLTLNLERRLSKQQIFEDYANQVYLGRRDTFSIHGFAEGARAYFSKDISQLNDGEAALLAGMVQRPSYYNPFRYPERARQRRDLVLSMMCRNGYLRDAEYQGAIDSPLGLHPDTTGDEQNHYFVDLVRREMQDKMSDERPANVYTSLDPDLQEAAEAAVRLGMAEVDRLLHGHKNDGLPPDQPQVALVALDPRTGLIKALVGGRDYAVSQLNHVLAKRQPGSVFKPFVYTAALTTAGEGVGEVYTPASIIDDTPINFLLDGPNYEPHDFHQQPMGEVSLRYALAHSLNLATVRLATQVGLDKVVAIAQRMGLNGDIKPTPAVALGAYETTPLEIAAAYAVFANQGNYVPASSVLEARTSDGQILYRHSEESRPVLDPRVAFLMVNMMQDVLRNGTGAGVRSLGFTLPAAGKTGTSHDGWFAGFTSELVCVVWVGFDDDRDLNLEGARSALPIWTEFMKRAARFAPYRNAKPFPIPDGVREAQVCADSGELASPFCPNTRREVFLEGTEPLKQCSIHQGPPASQGNITDLSHNDSAPAPDDSPSAPPDNAPDEER